MYWYIWWGISVFIFLAAIIDAFVLSKIKYNRKRILTPNKLLIAGTFFSAAFLLCPIYAEKFSDSLGWVEWGKSILLSMQHSVRLFAFEGDFMEFFDPDTVTFLDSDAIMLFTGMGAVLYTFAPLLTFGVILSFFKNVSAYRKYLFSFWKETHVFSELNEKSLALAKSIDDLNNKVGEGESRRYKLFRKALIVFTDVLYKDDEENINLLEEAKEMDAVLFSKDLESVRYRSRLFSIRKIRFYLISEDEEEKIHHAESIMHDYDIPEAELRVFSDDIRSELLLAAKNVTAMKVIRVNDIQSLIYHDLDVHGLRLFENARKVQGDKKIISVIIVGMGRYGMEMTKALAWFCQMDGYRLKINAFDMDKNAREHFENICPELMSDRFNGQEIPGEAYYEINIHGGVDINSSSFAKSLSKINDATYIFVSLGSDEDNLSASVRIRSLCEGIRYTGDHRKPDIETVIYDSDIAETMGVKWEGDRTSESSDGICNFRKQPYNIHMIGDLDHLYSVDTILDSDIVNVAFEKNKNYAETVYKKTMDDISGLEEPEYSMKKAEADKKKAEDIRAFYKFEYNYRSSVARVIHDRKCEILEKKSPELEHKRWNAYMRAEGYRFSGSENEASRNDLAKLHHNLVPYASLDAKRDIPKDE